MSDKNNDLDAPLLKSSVTGALLNSAVAIGIKIVTFVLNAFVIRHVASDILGIINVRLLLLSDSILFVSREAFRKSCLCKPENGNWRGTINLVWLSVPVGIGFCSIFGYWWTHMLDLPSQPEFARQYAQAVILMCLSSLVELFYEVLFVIGQIFVWVKFRSFADMTCLGVRAISLAVIVTFYPER